MNLYELIWQQQMNITDDDDNDGDGEKKVAYEIDTFVMRYNDDNDNNEIEIDAYAHITHTRAHIFGKGLETNQPKHRMSENKKKHHREK